MVRQLPERSPHEPTSRPALQFSLITLFILTTLFALVLSAFFGISQVLAVSAGELLRMSVIQFIGIVPAVVVWSIGLAMAVRSYPKPAMLATVALAGFIATAVLIRMIQAAVFAGMSSGQFANASRIFGILSGVDILINVILWVLILMAIFSGRPISRNQSDGQSDTVDPF